MKLERPGPCPHCDSDEHDVECVGVPLPSGGIAHYSCPAARAYWDAGHAVGLTLASAAVVQAVLDAMPEPKT